MEGELNSIGAFLLVALIKTLQTNTITILVTNQAEIEKSKSWLKSKTLKGFNRLAQGGNPGYR